MYGERDYDAEVTIRFTISVSVPNEVFDYESGDCDEVGLREIVGRRIGRPFAKLCDRYDAELEVGSLAPCDD